jgi:hypothetical protein
MFSTIAILLVGCFAITLAVLLLASVTDGRRGTPALVTRPIRGAERKSLEG